MNQKFIQRIAGELQEINEAGLFKNERVITSEQGAEIVVNGKITNYEGRSSYQIIIDKAEIAGIGAILNGLPNSGAPKVIPGRLTD
mgnify:CR=1 FL=1